MTQDGSKPRVAKAAADTDPHANAEATTRIVRCPHCGGDSIYGPSNPYRPFCGARCKGLDFGAWADESFRMAAQTEPDEMAPPADSRLQ